MSIATAIHKSAVQADLQTMATTLTDVLGRVVVADIVGVRNPKTISRWSTGEVTNVRDRYSEERLIAAWQIVHFLQEYEGTSTIRSFMLGMNPHLDDRSPVRVLQDGQVNDVMAAARAFVADDYA